MQSCKFDVAYGIDKGLEENGLRMGGNERMRIASRICGKAAMHKRISTAR